jgi:hypothetical protein
VVLLASLFDFSINISQKVEFVKISGLDSYSFIITFSLFKSFWNILGLPYLNQYDAGATDLSDFFTDTPNFKPYNALKIDSAIFNPQKALDPFDEKFDWKAVKESPEIDNMEDMFRESKEQDEYRLKNREKNK